MTETAGRLLRLLPLLTARPSWRGDELADRLGVTTRTVRRDIDRLRELGYPVRAIPGRLGGYGARRSLLTSGADSLDSIALHLALLGIPFTPLEPPELRDRCAVLAERLHAAAHRYPAEEPADD